MAIRPIEALKAYFYEHAYPTWQQFHDVLDSLRHKNDKIPIADVDGLADQLNGKASADAVNAGHVASSTIDDNGHLILTLNDGSQLDAGLARGLDGDPGEDGQDGTNAPLTVTFFKTSANGLVPVTGFKWITNLTVSEVILIDADDISVTIGATTYDHNNLVGASLPAGIKMANFDMSITTGLDSAQAIIIFTQA